MDTITRLKKENFEECMDFIDFVFSKDQCPHDFVSSMPKVNRPEDKLMENYYGMRIDGKLCCTILSWPMDAMVGNIRLKVFGIGNVASHPRYAGRGYMAKLMNVVQNDMSESGCDFSVLGGLRQRYDHFGYERSGLQYCFAVTKRNCKKCLGDAPKYTFKKLNPDESSDMDFCRDLYESDKVHNMRGDNKQFYYHLTGWDSVPFVVVDPSGDRIGYISANGGGINELFAVEEKYLLDIIHAYLDRGFSKEAYVHLYPWQRSAIKQFDALAENVTICPVEQVKVFRWDRVVQAFFNVKAEYAPLLDGNATIGIENWGNLEITVNNNRPEVTATNKKADNLFSGLDATRLIFGPDPDLVAELPALLKNWFPLPFAWHNCDGV